jgi:hypothetical protein
MRMGSCTVREYNVDNREYSVVLCYCSLRLRLHNRPHPIPSHPMNLMIVSAAMITQRPTSNPSYPAPNPPVYISQHIKSSLGRTVFGRIILRTVPFTLAPCRATRPEGISISRTCRRLPTSKVALPLMVAQQVPETEEQTRYT